MSLLPATDEATRWHVRDRPLVSAAAVVAAAVVFTVTLAAVLRILKKNDPAAFVNEAQGS